MATQWQPTGCSIRLPTWLDTNADASASADASVMERDNAMTEDIQQTMADSISALFDRTLEQLIALRDVRYADAIEELDHESEALAKEHGQLEEDIRAIEAVLPSKERLTQHEVDELLLSSKPDAKQNAATKLAEVRELRRKPVERSGILPEPSSMSGTANASVLSGQRNVDCLSHC